MTRNPPIASEPHGWLYEDALPSNYPYDAMYPHSRVIDGVRMFPVYGPPGNLGNGLFEFALAVVFGFGLGTILISIFRRVF